MSSCTKTDSRITAVAVILIVTKDTNSCFRKVKTVTHNVESFLVTVALQRGLGTNQLLPRVTTQCGVAVLPVSDQ